MVDTSTDHVTRPMTLGIEGPRWSLGPVVGEPYAWPFDGSVDTRHVAVVCIDLILVKIRTLKKSNFPAPKGLPAPGSWTPGVIMRRLAA